ncbi:MAG: hypothetical protein ABI823_00160 [Bryobacteraceae bacterium]
MDDVEREQIRQWAAAWKRVAPQLEEIKRRELRDIDTMEALAALEPAFNHATRTLPPRESSGLIEMQRLFAKIRNR